MLSASSRARTALHLLIIVLVGIAAYSNSFTVPFFLDDETSIFDNNIVKDLGRFLSAEGYAYNPRRFIGYLTIALNHHFGGVDVTGYHAVNLLIHILSGCLVYSLARLTLRTPFFADRASGETSAFKESLLPLIAALLFVVHPIQTQAVTYIVQRFASLATLFYLLSIVCYAKARLLARPEGGTRVRTAGLYLCAVLAAGCAMKTKEIAFTLPFIVLLYEFFFFRLSRRGKLAIIVPAALIALLVPLSVLGGGWTGDLLDRIAAVTRADTQMARFDYLLTQFPVIVTYLRLMLLPVNQNLDYDFPIYRSFLSPAVFFSFLLLAALFALAALLYARRDRRPELRLISFGIFWFFITLSVESSVIPIADVIFEHRVYLPSVGLSLAFGAGASLLASKFSSRSVAVAAGLVVVLLGVGTFARNMVWQSELSMWSDVTQKSPLKARPHYNLGLALYRAQRYDEALEQARTAARLDQTAAYPYNLMGSILGKKGEFFGAITAFNEAVRRDPKDVEPHLNLADTYRLRGLYQQALREYEIALKQNSTNPDIYYKIGTVHEMTGAMDKAATFYGCAVSLAPGRQEYARELARLRTSLQR